jgi:hypothetical protein
MNKNNLRGLIIAGGICAILWPLLSELLFYVLYPILAASSKIPTGANMDIFLQRTAELANNKAIVALEWGKVATPLLLIPFLLALYKTLNPHNQHNLTLVAVSIGFVSIVFMMLGHIFNSTVNHALGQGYTSLLNEASRDTFISVTSVFHAWHRGINQTASLLYQGCVGLFSLALIRTRIWKILGWAGLAGSLLALVAKLTPGLEGISNLTWTALAYFIWPVGLGIGLLKLKMSSIPVQQ